MSNDTKEAIAKAPRGRATRTPIGTRNILTVNNKDEGYVYRVVNDVDDGDRVHRFLEAGYEIAENTVGDKRVDNPSREGKGSIISVGGGRKGVVMRIKKEWYEEDQLAKQRDVDASEESISKPADALSGMYGQNKIKRS